MTGKELLAVAGVTKAYPGVVANSDVSFSIAEGEVHALLGENGAGKSTLVKMIYGLVKPDAGTMRFRGQAYTPAEPRQARTAGVAPTLIGGMDYDRQRQALSHRVVVGAGQLHIHIAAVVQALELDAGVGPDGERLRQLHMER